MEHASAAARVVRPIDVGLLAAAAQRAADSVGTPDEPAKAIERGTDAFYEAVAGAMPSVFVLEHGRLWLVAQRGYAVVPDGLTVERGITGRAVRLATAQLVTDVRADPDYVPALPGVVSELAIPLSSGRNVVGILNVESERALPDGAAEALLPLVRALAPVADALRARRTLDLPALARLFVHLGSLRSPDDIAALAAASLPRVLPVDATQILVWDELGAPAELASWTSQSGTRPPLDADEIDVARAQSDPSVVCQVLELQRTVDARSSRSAVWLPLRANAGELGAMVGICAHPRHVDPNLLDTAAVLAAHVAASLDAAFALQRERQSAMTDPLTRILNRRGLEELLEREVAVAQERRVPLSLLVIDCDDFKEINDRAGHEFGDALLREVADVLSGCLPEGAEAARLGGDEFVVMIPGADSDSAEALGAPDPDAARRRADGRGIPAQDLGGRLDVPLRRRDADVAPARRRPGSLRCEVGRKGSRRLVPGAAARRARRGRRRERDARRRGDADGATARGPFSRTHWPRRRRSRRRRPSTPCAAACARRWSSSSARRRAPPHASSATTSSMRPTMRCARSPWATKPRTASPTFRSPPTSSRAASLERCRSSRETSIRRRRSSSASSG